MFRNQKIADAFSVTTDYYFEKIFESINARDRADFGLMHIRLIAEALERFKVQLAERGLKGAHDTVEYHLDLVAYPLQEVALYFQGGSSKLNERDAYIFASFIQDQVRELRAMADELDESYANGSGDGRANN